MPAHLRSWLLLCLPVRLFAGVSARLSTRPAVFPLAALLACLLAGLPGVAPAAPAMPASPAALAAPSAAGRTVPDTLERRVAACLACHGDQDRQGAPAAQADERRYFPRIAGKPAGYLFNQMQNFRAGRRQYPLMTWMVTPLSDDYLREIAAWFAGQHPPVAVAARAGLPADAVARGRELVLHGDPARKVPACTACHGERLTGVLPAIPGLLGLPRDYINAQFGAWRNGTRHTLAPDCMGTIAGRLSLADVAAVSAWLASEPLPPDPAPATALPRPLPLACGSHPERP